MDFLPAIWGWFWENPARLMVVVSLILTWLVIREEWRGRESGGSGWLTLGRMVVGAGFALLTAIVAAFFGGTSAFFIYLLVQIVIAVVAPYVILGKMADHYRKSKGR